MSVSVTMPRLGESVSEGTVTRWLKQEGERVEADEPLLEVSTDKVDTEIPSPAAGVLRSIKVGEDETVEVGSELAVIDDGAGGGESSGDNGAGDSEAADDDASEVEPAEVEDTSPAEPEPEEESAADEPQEQGGTPAGQEQPERRPESDGGAKGES